MSRFDDSPNQSFLKTTDFDKQSIGCSNLNALGLLPERHQRHQPTMTSREIAELLTARHDNVRRTIERLVEKRVISLPPLEEVKIQRERRAETIMEYVFSGEAGKRDSYVVVAQLSPEFTARIVDRWQELEADRAQAPALPRDYVAALRALADQTERTTAEIAVRDSMIAVLEPRSDALERLTEASGTFNLTETAKALQMRRCDLIDELAAREWIWRRAGGKNWLGYEAKVKQRLIVHKVDTVERSDGSEKIVEQVRFTAKGMAKLAILLGKEWKE
jgi:phage regulator Rha-like protein